MGREATLWLIDRGIRAMGTDGWGWDIPIPMMVERLRGGDCSAFFPGHYAGRERESCHAEKLARLDALWPRGFQVALLSRTAPLTWEHVGFSGDFLRGRVAAAAGKRRPLNLGPVRRPVSCCRFD